MTKSDQIAPGKDAPWIFRTYAGHSTAATSNRLYRSNLEKGQTGLSIAFDLPTQTGYDPDHPLARGEVGKVGVPVSHLGDMRALFDQIADRVEDRVERILVPRQHHPRGQRTAAFLAKGIEHQIDHLALGPGAGAAGENRRLDPLADGDRQMLGEGLLQPGGRAEMVQQVGVSPPDPRGDRLQGYRLRPFLDQQGACRLDSSLPAFLVAEAFPY